MGHDSTGTKTISVEGMYAYQRDMREFKNLFSQYSYVLTDNDFSEAERLLVAMENHSAECKRKAT
jgi:hypothetical protein